MNFLSLFTEKELLIMALVIAGLLLIVIILAILELLDRKKYLVEDENNEENKINNGILESSFIESSISNENIETTNETINIENNEEIKTNLEEFTPSSEDDKIEELLLDDEPVIKRVDIQDENISPVKKAKIELEKIEEEITNQPSLEDTLTNLETIEEQNAIISYQELLENTNDLTTVLEDDGDEPITLDEVFKLFNGSSDSGVIVNEALEALPIEEAYRGEFNSTPYLSPVNGLENENLAEIQLENTANLEKLDKEIRKTNQFLNILNELKKNLE